MRVVAFCAAAALFVGLLFGVMPAWRATAFSSAQVIGSDTRTTTGSSGRLRGLLVIGEVAMAVFLLSGAGLLLRTLARRRSLRSRVSRRQRPLDARRSARLEVSDREALQQFYDQVEAEIAAVPGVAGVAWASDRPLDFFDAGGFSFEIVGDPPLEDRERPGTAYQVVSPAYFSTLDLPILAGRAFDRRDARDGVPVCIVNEAFARAFRGRSPVGQRVALRPTSSPEAKPVVREIVGVARQVKGRPDETAEFVQVYVPMAQDLSDDIFLVVRPKSGAAEALAPSVRAAISRVDREQLVSVRSVMTLEDIARAATGRHRFRAVMVMAFAALALVLAMVGVFGILAYTVQQSVRDIGVRRALGATTHDVLRLVLVNALRVVGTGAGDRTRAGRHERPLDRDDAVRSTAARSDRRSSLVTIVLGITAALSIVGPAWRAARIDPAVALRNT